MTTTKTISSGVGAVAPTLSLLSGSVSINGLGDSITALSGIYFPVGTSFANVPAWQANTAYIAGNLAMNGGILYRCTVAGTSAASGGPTGFNLTGIADNTAQWGYATYNCSKSAYSYLYWVEALSLGRLHWDMSQGYSGVQQSLVKVIVANGGSNYSAPTVTFNGGATGTVQTLNGVVSGITITNPGYLTGASFTASLSDGTGSGATLSVVGQPSGTFGVSGTQTSDMVARLADVMASACDIIVVHGGTNDVSAGRSVAVITANLQACYETLMRAGKKVIAVPISPRMGLTNAQMAVLLGVNRWIRGFSRKRSWANGAGFSSIVLADPTRYLTDGTSATNQPVGLAAAGIGAMTQDGLHLSQRGAQYLALHILKAAEEWIGTEQYSPARVASMFDGYDSVANPGGNYIEGYPWQASYSYALNQLCSNNSNIYICTTAGASAGSGGPSSTGSNIADNITRWKYLYPQGLSVFGTGTQALSGTAGSVTCSGSLARGYSFQRLAGSAAGTITGAIENPWSDGQAGTRQSLVFSLGSGSHNEQWVLYLWSLAALTGLGFNVSDLGATSYVAECEVEVTGAANLMHIALQFWDGNNGSNQCYNEAGKTISPGGSSHLIEMNSSGEMLSLPVKRLIRTQPFVFPATLTTLSLYLLFAFDCSGGAGSAAGTIKINHLSVRKAVAA